MLEAFKAGGDFHSRTAMNMYPHIREAIEKRHVLLEWDPQPGEEKPPVPLLKVKFFLKGSETLDKHEFLCVLLVLAVLLFSLFFTCYESFPLFVFSVSLFITFFYVKVVQNQQYLFKNKYRMDTLGVK